MIMLVLAKSKKVSFSRTVSVSSSLEIHLQVVGRTMAQTYSLSLLLKALFTHFPTNLRPSHIYITAI